MIAENAYLVPDSIAKSYAEANRVLLAITDLEKDDLDEEEEETVKTLDYLKKKITDKYVGINNAFKDMKDTINKMMIKNDSLNQMNYNEIKKKINPD
jgi:hypothetical protein